MNSLNNIVPYDKGPEIQQKIRERDESDGEERPKKRPRSDTPSLIEDDGEGSNVQTPPKPEAELISYNRERLQNGLRFLYNESKRNITPRTVEFLNMHKDAYKVALENDSPPSTSLAVVQALDRVYFSASFYFKPRSTTENDMYMCYVNLRRMELLANYGDYAGQKLQEIRANLKAAAADASDEVHHAAKALGPPQSWIQIADQLEGADMNILRTRVAVACGVLGLDPNHVEWLIKEWADRNKRYHNSIREYIKDCDWPALARQTCLDLAELPNVETDAETRGNYEKVLRSIMGEYFNVIDDEDARFWFANERAIELTKKKVARKKKLG